MRAGNLQSGSGQLQDALEKLMLAWNTTRDAWVDQKAVDFEETYLQPIVEEVGLILPVIGKTSQVMGRAVRECEE